MPINQALKDTIEYYTDRMSDDEIVEKMYNHPNQQDLKETIDYYRNQGATSADILDKMMAAPNAPEVAEAQPAPVPQMTPAEEQPSTFMPGRLKVGQPEPVLEAPPEEWRQRAMAGGEIPIPLTDKSISYPGINTLPEIAQNVGILAGAGAGPMGAVAGGALGRGAGAVLQSPLQKLLLPKSTAENLGIGGTISELAKGGTAGAEAAIGGRVMAAPKETLADILASGKKVTGSISKGLARRALRQPIEPGKEGVLETIPREKFNITSGKGPAQVAEKVSSLSRQVDAHIGAAEEAGKMISREDILSPARKLAAYYDKAADTSEYANKLRGYIADVETKYPEMIKPSEAQEMKKFVYDAINFDAKAASQLGQVGVQGKKAVGRGLRGGLEEVAPEIGAINRTLGDILEARPYIQTAAEKYTGGKMRSRLLGKVEELGARGAGAVSRGLEAAEQAVRPEAAGLESIGNPFANLEATLGLKYPRLSSEINTIEGRPERLLEAPAGGGRVTGPAQGGKASYGAAAQPSEQGLGLERPALPPGTQYGPLPGEIVPRTRNRFGGTVPVPENLPERGFQGAAPMKVQDLINKIAEGRGHEITAEDKLDLADALIKRISIKIQGSSTTPKENPLGFNFGERMKE